MAVEKEDLLPGRWAEWGDRGHSASTLGLTLSSVTPDTLSLKAANSPLSQLVRALVAEFPSSC